MSAHWFPVTFKGVEYIALAKVPEDDEPDVWSVYVLQGEGERLDLDGLSVPDFFAFMAALTAVAFDYSHPAWADFPGWREERFPREVPACAD